MVHTEIKFGKSACIIIDGDSEEISVELQRDFKTDWCNTFHKHPGFFETIFPAYNEKSPTGIRFSEKSKEELFRQRIEQCIKVMTSVAYDYVYRDQLLEKQKAEKQKSDDRKQMDFKQFIDSVTRGIGDNQ